MEKKFFDGLKTDVEEHLQKLNQTLLLLEKQPGNRNLIEKFQREIHTLKGLANMLGWSGIGKISHEIEYLLVEFIEGRMNFTTEITNFLFATLDVIGMLIESEISGEPSGIDVEGICQKLEGLKKEGKIEGVIQPVGVKEPLVTLRESVRMPVSKLENLMGIVGELMISQMKSEERLNKFRQISPLIKDFLRSETNKEIMEGILNLFRGFSDEVFSFALAMKKLEETALGLRMHPLATIFTYFPRMVRDIAQEYGKQVELEIKGADTELDEKMLGVVMDSLMHILQNAVGHGIEKTEERLAQGKKPTGKITISTYQAGDRIHIEVTDDGWGINLEGVKEVALAKGIVSAEKIKKLTDEEVLYLIFKPGFSTGEVVTEVSGRGVGLDVVKKNIEENLKGEARVETKLGEGTKFTLILPLTLVTLRVLLVEANKQCFALPTTSVELITRVKSADFLSVEGRQAIQINMTIPVVSLAETLKLPGQRQIFNEKIPVVIILYAGQRIGFLVDRLLGEQNAVIYSLPEPIKRTKNIAGVTILATGEPIFILHIPDLMGSAQTPPLVSPVERVSSQDPVKKEVKDAHLILVVEDFFTTRELEKSILESWGYRVDVASDGLEALEKIAEKRYDLVIADIQMPRLDGFSLCEKLKKDERYKDLPVVIVSALEKEEEKRKGFQVGASAYIAKSAFEQKTLIDTIKKFIEPVAKVAPGY